MESAFVERKQSDSPSPLIAIARLAAVWLRRVCWVLVAMLAMVPALAQAQPAASQITPPSFRPNLERQGGFDVPGTPGLAAPPGADRLFVLLSGVSIKGGLPQLAAETREIEQRLIGRQVSGTEIFAAARDLEAAYANKGYVLVRVVLPPQRLVDGARLLLIVVNGFIERIDLKKVPDRVRERIDWLVGPIVGRRGLTQVEIERRVLLAGDTPGVVLRTTLAPGASEGATILVIEATYQPISVVTSFDNTLSTQLGTTTMGIGADFNSLGGFGELVYLRANGHPEGGANSFFDRYPTNRSLAGGFILPLWVDGLSFNAEVTEARTTPRATNGVQTTDLFQRMSFRLRYGWVRSRGGNFSSEIAFDAQDETQSLFVATAPVALWADRLRIVRFTNEGDVLTSWGGAVSGRVTGSFGIDALGARSAADANALLPLSRQGADAAFQKLEVTLGYAQALLEHLSVNLVARAQTSFGQALVRSEQLGIANTTNLSGFDSGSVVGDRGYVTRGEFSSPWVVPLPDNAATIIASPYVFGAYGEVYLENPTALEAAHIAATSYGGGLRIGGARQGTLSNGSVALEYSRATRNDGVYVGDRFTVVSAFRF